VRTGDGFKIEGGFEARTDVANSGAHAAEIAISSGTGRVYKRAFIFPVFAIKPVTPNERKCHGTPIQPIVSRGTHSYS